MISAEEAAIVTAARAATRRVIMVDDFAPEQMLPGASASGDAPARAKPALKKSARTKTAAKKAAAKKTAGKKSAAKKPVSKPAANGGEDGQQETET